MARNPGDKAFYARGRGLRRMPEDQQGYLDPPARPRKPRKGGKAKPAVVKDKPPA